MKKNRVLTGILAATMATTIIAGSCVTASAKQSDNVGKHKQSSYVEVVNADTNLKYTQMNDARLAKYDVTVGIKDGVIYSADWKTGGAIYHYGATADEVVSDVLEYSE